ncbi:MAG TPA: proton-conducting transporter membrane subunit [Candidatus Dormibacteraeota bacterium]|nr:proton-conducting transporter membrane subunit [Candidatus Dormibacteraeota bacterium]
MAFALILLPVVMAAIAAALPSNRVRPWLLPVTGLAHASMTVLVLAGADVAVTSDWLGLDAPGRVILPLVSLLFLSCSFYVVGYLHYRQELSNRVFCACLLTFLGVMSLVTWSRHLGLMWVAIEATTLVTAPLIYFNRTQRSIEATWKYLLVGSVGIALALLGTFFLAYASLHEGLDSTLTFDGLLRHAPQLSKPWLHAAFVLLLVGYGTKMGLAPMHTWKPDAYGEAPGVIGAMLAGGVTSCAFLAILRIYHICQAAGEGAYTSRLLLFMGLFSMAVAGVFMVGQRDFKRMLAYSSVEHMGILAVGLGIGGPALFGTMLHVVTNGLTKGVLFLSAGNIHRAYESKSTDRVRGAMHLLPLSGALFLAAFLAITGSPPFGPFISLFAILNGAIDAGRFVTAGVFLFLLLVVFIGMGATVLQVVQGRAPIEMRDTLYRDGLLTAAPVVVLMALVLLLGLYIPAQLATLLNDAVRFLESRP